MDKKYFETRKGSLEDKINTIAAEQPSISKPQTDVKLSVEKKYFETKKGSLEDLASKLVESKLDPVNKDAVKKKFDDRKDKDIDNDGDVDSSDKYLHKRRKAISKAIKSEITDKQKKLPKKLQAAIMKKEKEDGMKESIVDIQQQKNLSMREMLAKIWGVNEGRSPFEPQKTEQAKAPKTSKTESGQKATKVEINPEIAPVVQTQIVPNSDR